MTRGLEAFARILQTDVIDPEALLELLADRTLASDETPPETGLSYEWERRLSAIFVVTPSYGTRSSTVLLWEVAGGVTFVERTFGPGGRSLETRYYRVQGEAA